MNWQDGGHADHTQVDKSVPNRDPYPQALWDHPTPNTSETINLGDEGLSNGDVIDGYLETYLDDGVEVQIPEGNYVWERTGFGGYSDAKLVGMGGLGGVTLDHSGQRGRQNFYVPSGTMVVENIDIIGRADADDATIGVAANDPDAELILKRFRVRDGTVAHEVDRTVGFYQPSIRSGESVSSGHSGTLRMLWCQCTRFGDNGCYIDGPVLPEEAVGQSIVVGGFYSFNNISNLRIGHLGDTIYGATIVAAPDRTMIPYHGDDGYNQQRGISVRQPEVNSGYDWLDESKNLIDQCEFVYPEGAGGSGCIVLNGYGETDQEGVDEEKSTGRILRTRIQNDSEVPAINVIGDYEATGQWQAFDTHISGSGNTQTGLSLQGSSEIGSGALQPSEDAWWGDEVEGGDPIGPTLQTGWRNGQPAIRFDRDGLYETGPYSQALSPPYTYAVVAQYDPPSGDDSGFDYALYGYPDQGGHMAFDMDRDGSFNLWAGGDGVSYPGDTDPHVFLLVVDGQDSILRVDGVESAGNAGTNSQYGTVIGGNQPDQNRMLSGWVAQVDVYDRKPDKDERDAIVSDLSSKYGI